MFSKDEMSFRLKNLKFENSERMDIILLNLNAISVIPQRYYSYCIFRLQKKS